MQLALQIFCVVFFVWSIAWLSAKLARNKAKLEALELEKSQNEIISKIYNMPIDDVRDRLQQIYKNK